MAEDYKRNGKSERPQFLSKDYGVCVHCNDREDLVKECIVDYKKLLEFKRKLHLRLKDEATDEQVIDFILQSLENDQEKDQEKERFFEDKH